MPISENVMRKVMREGKGELVPRKRYGKKLFYSRAFMAGVILALVEEGMSDVFVGTDPAYAAVREGHSLAEALKRGVTA
ncbi:hypothetical protein [Shimia sp.]|uniref:hypothetical protein n=1 Tax=Shimia sp. TaxID=1954381 RepID=UPI003298F581